MRRDELDRVVAVVGVLIDGEAWHSRGRTERGGCSGGGGGGSGYRFGVAVAVEVHINQLDSAVGGWAEWAGVAETPGGGRDVSALGGEVGHGLVPDAGGEAMAYEQDHLQSEKLNCTI